MIVKTPTKECLAESARYALLRRLAPMLRHNTAGALQPLIFISTILEKRLQHPSPDLAELSSKTRELRALARVASNACMDLVSWITPNSSELITVAAGVEDVLGLVRAELSFKGFTIVNNIDDMQAQLPRSLTRNVFAAALVALTDAATAPANVVVQAQRVDSELVLTISIQPVRGDAPTGGTPSYRNLEVADVQALAEVESVRLTASADSVKLFYPLTWATPKNGA